MKPAPDLVLSALEALGVVAAEAVFVGEHAGGRRRCAGRGAAAVPALCGALERSARGRGRQARGHRRRTSAGAGGGRGPEGPTRSASRGGRRELTSCRVLLRSGRAAETQRIPPAHVTVPIVHLVAGSAPTPSTLPWLRRAGSRFDNLAARCSTCSTRPAARPAGSSSTRARVGRHRTSSSGGGGKAGRQFNAHGALRRA
jgi:hypothetical protein